MKRKTERNEGVKSKIRFVDDPLHLVALAFSRLYPSKAARIVIQPLRKRLGCAAFGRGRTPQISLDPRQSYIGCLDILAHELAHVAYPSDRHGDKWETAYNAIHAEYLKMVRARSRRVGTKSISVKIPGAKRQAARERRGK